MAFGDFYLLSLQNLGMTTATGQPQDGLGIDETQRYSQEDAGPLSSEICYHTPTELLVRAALPHALSIRFDRIRWNSLQIARRLAPTR